MKSLIKTIAVAVAFAAPVVSFAQPPVTRAQVRAELVQLESVGYRVGNGDRTNYPRAIQEAEAKVAVQQADGAGAYGGVANGSSDVGRPRDIRVSSYSAPIYSHH
jgi:FlaG/FlaF family flagellin (archaellin)